MDVVIYSSGMPFNGETVSSRSLGGSESAAYYLAREIAARGHRVKVFTSEPTPESEADGVKYIWHGAVTESAPLGERFEHYARNTPHDLLIVQRVPVAFHQLFAAKVCIWQLHDLALYRSAQQVLGGTWQIDAITTVSEWHRKQVLGVWALNPEFIHVVPNGVDPDLYRGECELDIRYDDNPRHAGFADDGALVVPPNKFLLLYQSRPERGLNYALDLMDRAKQTGLPLHLLVCGYDNTTQQMAPLYQSLHDRAATMDNVTMLGALAKPRLAALQRRCDLLLYPTKFEEVSCITAMEAMHAALPMLTSDHAALPETCKDSGTHLVPLKPNGEPDLEAFDAWLQTVFGLVRPGEYPAELNEMREKQRLAAQTRTWERATDALLGVYDRCIKARRSSHGAVLRNAIEHSDIGFAEWYLREHAKDADDPIVEQTRDEVARLYAFKDSSVAYADHYAVHQTAYYEEYGKDVVGEDVTHTARFRGTWHFLAEHIRRSNSSHLRVLDYGCAHGHYTIPMAKVLSTCEFVGVDISYWAVETARRWADRDGVQNVKFVLADQSILKGQDAELDALGAFDVIIAGEVVEHVWDYCALLNDLKGRLRPGGCLIITTPTGRWEHSGTAKFREAREHLHHFEREDIEDICRGHEVEILHAPAGMDHSGFPLGSWVWGVWPNPSIPFWKVDYGRKLAQYAPRQTISACMIVKDGERTLRRSVESFVDWVDELIICIDPATKDRTQQIAAQLAADFPNRPIRYRIAKASALRDGFEAARNESIEEATGDWILWVDADEEIRRPWMLHKLVRPSTHNGYGFPQVHYSVDPDQVLTTDYPCRLFRNRIGVRFYGMVHEHPEQELGKAVHYSLVRPEVKFLHHGYYDEETRRARFRRNLPLMYRDVQKYPDNRPLNKFLLLRDLAQTIQFDSERRGPQPAHLDKAREGIRLMEQIVDMPQMKMLSDAMPYYSLCVATTGSGFDAEVSMRAVSGVAPDLAVSANVKGRFHSREFYAKVVAKLSQESTRHYEDRYL